jgi:hypothetical protein
VAQQGQVIAGSMGGRMTGESAEEEAQAEEEELL